MTRRPRERLSSQALRWPTRWRRLASVAAICLSLAGCSGGSMSDLEAHVEDVLARPGKRPADLPPIEPYVVYQYKSGDDKDPFQPFYTKEIEPPPDPCEPTGEPTDTCIRPNTDRNREELESYSLDSLRMMGTLERDERVWGIVRSPNSVIHRIQVGNYIGRNHGKIVNITEDSIDLIEIVSDGRGGWVERQASLALLE